MSLKKNYLKSGTLLLATIGLVCAGGGCADQVGFREYGAYNDENGIRLYIDKFAYRPHEDLKVTIENRTLAMIEFSFCPLQLEVYDLDGRGWLPVPENADTCKSDVYRIDPTGRHKFYVDVSAIERGLYRIKLPGFTAGGVKVDAQTGEDFTTPVFSVVP